MKHGSILKYMHFEIISACSSKVSILICTSINVLMMFDNIIFIQNTLLRSHEGTAKGTFDVQ